MDPTACRRPALTLVRCPTGVRANYPASTKSPDCFFMKHSKVWAPPSLRRVRIREKTKLGEYLIADSLAAIVGLVQMDVLEIHTWNSKFSRLEQPDRIDLDPGAGVEWRRVVDAARLVRQLLTAMDLESCRLSAEQSDEHVDRRVLDAREAARARFGADFMERAVAGETTGPFYDCHGSSPPHAIARGCMEGVLDDAAATAARGYSRARKLVN